MSAFPVTIDKDTHVYFDEVGLPIQFPSVTGIIEGAGISDYSSVPEEFRDRGMYRGTQVHWMVQLETQGILNYRKVPRILRPYRKGFNTWLKRSGFIPVWTERSFFHPVFGFTGTLDLAGRFPSTSMVSEGCSAIVDIKTGWSVMNWVRYQLCAYSTFVYPDFRRARYVRRIALLLKPDGTYSIKEFPIETWDHDFATFIKAKEKVCQLRP